MKAGGCRGASQGDARERHGFILLFPLTSPAAGCIIFHMRRDAFAGFHPLVNMIYFTLVIGFSFVFMHPVSLGVSLICGVAYMLLLEGRRALRFVLAFLLPVFLLAAAVNPLFSHAGATILAYLPNGNPVTLEAIFFGIASAGMLVAVIAWFRSFSAVMTGDKFAYLFGRAVPALSLLLSMALRLIPRFTAQMKAVAHAQRGIGRDVTQGSVLRRARHGMRILSVTVTWALENAIETADSMKSRGYGLPGRRAFSIYRFDARDKCALTCLLAGAVFVIAGAALGALRFQYFPSAEAAWQPFAISTFAVYAVLFAWPLILNAKEAAQWKRWH